MNLSVSSHKQLRRCRVLAGSADWAARRLAAVSGLPPEQYLWIAESAAPGISYTVTKQFRQCLGSECSLLVFDAHAGFVVDAFAAVLGTLRHGGELVLLVPKWLGWEASDPARASFAPYPLTEQDVGQRFLRRFIQQFDAAGCVSVETEATHQEPLSFPALPLPESVFSLTTGQQKVVDAVKRVALGHAGRPLVVTADRGRGKSTALGVALAALLREQHKQVLLLAPSASAVAALFAALQRDLPQGKLREQGFSWASSRVQFRLPDEQLLLPQSCDLLVIDEASAIAVPVLEALLQAHNRVVFSSTVHGYEGSGRGFALRFSRVLDRLCPKWKSLTLEEPVRWAVGDPLESLLNRSLLLDVEVDPPAVEDAVDYRWLSQQALVDDERQLRNLFALLVSAHYQTRPSDLRQLLDAPELRVLVARSAGAIVGVALLVEEGGFDTQLAHAVCAGQRRPHGHMLVQSLAAHAGLCDAPRRRLLRVMRIAVLDGWRGQGIGSALLREAISHARQQAFDLFGTAFGVDAPLLRFWQRMGLKSLRLGHRRDPASGTHSVQMAMGLSHEGETLVKRGAARFQQQFPWRLGLTFQQLPTDAAIALLRGRDCTDLPLSVMDQADIEAFACQRRGLQDAHPALWRWLCHELAVASDSDPDLNLLVPVVLQNRALSCVPLEAGLSGRKAQLNTLRAAVARRLQQG